MVAAIVSGCATAATPTPADTSGVGTTPPTGSTSQGLRGFAVSTLSCDLTRLVIGPGRPQPITGDVAEYWICPARFGDTKIPVTPTQPSIVTAQDGASFDALDTVLRLADQPRAHACRLFGIVAPEVFAHTSTGDWVVHLPTDRCGRPRRIVIETLTHVQAKA